MENNRLYVLPSIVLGVSLVLGTIIVAGAFYRVKSLGNTISVTGSAEKVVMSDTAKWTSSVARTAAPDNLKEGSSQLKKDVEKVVAYLKNNGIKAEEITLQPLVMTSFCDNPSNVMYDKYGNQGCSGNRISNYNLSQTVIVETGSVDKIKDLSQKSVDDLLNQGVLFTSQGVEYYYNKLADLRLELLAAATENAEARAAKIAQSSGAKIGKLQSANMGVFQVTAKNSIEYSDYGAYDVSALEKKVTAIVRAGFTLK